MPRAARLDPAQVFRQLVLGLAILVVTSRREGFPRPKEREAVCVELIGDGIAVLLDERSFASAVRFVGLRNLIVASTRSTQPFLNAAEWLLPRQHVIGDPAQPGAMLCGIVEAHQPGQR